MKIFIFLNPISFQDLSLPWNNIFKFYAFLYKSSKTSMQLKKLFLLSAILMIRVSVFAQQPENYRMETSYRKALELFDHQGYSSADILFQKVFTGNDLLLDPDLNPEKENELKTNARFYSVFCELELHLQNIDEQALALIDQNPNSPLVLTAYYHLGNFYFFKKDYIKAFMSFEKTNIEGLTPAQQEEYYFNLGYSYFTVNRLESAQINFSKLISSPGTYREDALYYSGHISFANKEYIRALAEFSALSKKGKYSDIKPLYVNQIYLIQRRYDAVIDSGTSELTVHHSKHAAELNRLIGSAYFFKKDFAQAAHYFEQFQKDTANRKENTQNRYQIGFTLYKIGEYEKAIKELKPLYSELDSYAQDGLYVLGLCYLKLDQKNEARNAFRQSTSIPGESEVTENALSYYVKLSYELGLNNDALSAARIYSANFSSSGNAGEIKTLEGELLISSKNYPEAYRTLKSIPNRSPDAEAAFQKVSYYNGLEQYNLNHFKEAISYFEESFNHPQSKEVLSLSHFWAGETEFELQNYDKAIQEYQLYLSTSNSKSPVYKDAIYGQAYAYFKKGNYPKALSLFQKFKSAGSTDNAEKEDATSRMADCYFMLREYEKANSLYTENTQAVKGEQDYALFQSATILGLQNNTIGKIKTLQDLINQYPNSTYADKSQYEIGSAYLSLNNNEKAIEEFKKLANQYPKSPLVPKSMLSMGLVLFNTNQDEEALNQFKKVINDYPGSPESKSALASIKNIYLQKNDAAGFISYAGTLGNNSVSQNAQDSISYQSGNKQFLLGNYQGSVQSFNFYLQKFPQGNFSAVAHYKRAKSLEKLGRLEDAQSDYESLIQNKGNNTYQVESLVNLSTLYLKNKDYNKAIPVLKNLTQTAQLAQDFGFGVEGLLLAYNGLGNEDSVLVYAAKIKEFSKSSPYQMEEAGLYGAKAYLAKGDTSNAEIYLNPVIKSSRSVLGAESRYLSADIQYLKGNYKGSQQILFDLIKQLPGFDYWVGKSFILLADNYIGLGDTFQAKGTLQSLVDHYTHDDDVKKTAREKLSQLQVTK